LITLADLLPGVSLPQSAAGKAVRGLAEDSRRIERDFVFFALSGAKADGLAFAPAALAAGASAIVCERAPQGADRSVYIEVADARLALARAASIFHPRQPGTIVAVTGTSGKTSVAAFVRQIWSRLGRKAAALGTTGIITDDGVDEGALTTPDPITLHRALDRLAVEGFTHLAMEASSHGLDQKRLDGVKLTAAGFTNLSRDHLDYHPDMDAYLAAKMRLFEALLAPGQTAVVDADNEYSPRVVETCVGRGLNVFTTGSKGDGLHLVEARAGAAATRLVIDHAGGRREIVLPLAGSFMAANALVAAGLCIASGEQADAVISALEHLRGAPGRLEKVGERNGAPVFVDYAHKPDALEKVLAALRPMTSGRLVLVFGCGGDRDRGKRPIMGEIAVKGADVVIVTDDNPRSEEPAAIRAEILAAAPGAIEIGDRAKAIAHAVSLLRTGDALLIAGKGHETGQKIGAIVLPFSDHEAARKALAEA
jgi:UDP-N-acetylmuramoyl-L-alanyl-D-glutamate--2,6-diaminopimelate ligase